MQFLFRADASINIGSGHIMRCLTLAEALKKQGHHCRFACRKHEGNLIEQIQLRGFDVLVLSQQGYHKETALFHSPWLGTSQTSDAQELSSLIDNEPIDWLIVDHYALDSTWEKIISAHTQHIMVIDDLADRHHYCDLLLDQNIGQTEDSYKPLLEKSDCQLLVGSEYTLLRPEFALLRKQSLARREKSTSISNILISLGGVDKDNVTASVLTELEKSNLTSQTKITLVMGASAPHLDNVNQQALLSRFNVQVVVNIKDMAQRMTDADLAIGAAGSTSWERCCLGLPTLMFVLADNQKTIAKQLEAVGAVKLSNIATLATQISSLTVKELYNMSRISSNVVSGKGVALVVKEINS